MHTARAAACAAGGAPPGNRALLSARHPVQCSHSARTERNRLGVGEHRCQAAWQASMWRCRDGIPKSALPGPGPPGELNHEARSLLSLQRIWGSLGTEHVAHELEEEEVALSSSYS